MASKKKRKPPQKPEPRKEVAQPSSRLSRKWVVILALVMLPAAAGVWVFADWWIALPEDTVATYVGRQSCVQCHTAQAKLWEGSHHDLAMDHATDATVLGDFNNAEITHHGITSRIFRRDGKFMVNTEGPDGKLADFEVKYVFGVDPLQQYMVEFDRTADMPEGEIARLQVLRISWDTRRGKWFYLSPPDVPEKLEPDDDLHWTGIAQRWNTMCAECHSTDLRKNFDHKKNAYHTTYSEIDVSCEACHGPGSTHVKLAESKSLFWDRNLGYGLPHLKSENTDVQIHTCAQCHSRRRIVHPDFRPGANFYDHFANELLLDNTYHADGQIMDEVYVHGSFIQSKMYHKDIRCTDCHDPHSLKLKHEGNSVCTSCHQHDPAKYDTPNHHHHKDGSTGASCVECHMPETTYMAVDPRRDHSLRVPRPDLSVQLGTPNACTRCHLDKAKIEPGKRDTFSQYADWLLAARTGDEQVESELRKLDEWAAGQVNEWYPKDKQREGHFAAALAAARSGDPSAESQLLRIAVDRDLPAIVRATGLFQLGGSQSEKSYRAAVEMLKSNDPQIRAAALPRIESWLIQLRGETQQVLQQARRQNQMGNALAAQQHMEQAREALAQASSLQASAVSAFEPVVKQLAPLLSDEVRFVRTEAARVLAFVPPDILPNTMSAPQRTAFEDAIEEFKASQLVNNDRAGAHLMLGLLYENLGEREKAISSYRDGIRVQPQATGPRSNLANLLEGIAASDEAVARQAAMQGDRKSAQELIGKVVERRVEVDELRKQEQQLMARDARLAPNNAVIQYRHGLSLYLRSQQPGEAADRDILLAQAEAALAKALTLAPQNLEYATALMLLFEKQERWDDAEQVILKAAESADSTNHTLTLAQHYQRRERWDDAEQTLLKAHRRSPRVSDLVLALTLFYRQREHWADALQFAEKLIELDPSNSSFRELKAEIASQARGR